MKNKNICPICNIPMKIGKAINPCGKEFSRSLAPYKKLINANNLKIESVWKCPKCGYSALIE